ncbi:hypothetical protein PtA15_4A627 [Puccinia triticina]|uniref:EF-hand domain-containing protein n=1 Tax=Puccinia triticina TaxID=208348 RepID=A0ABY7CGG2_9BASI|nr:uncharacterized protein PtA15_4A627 [Puccinia triticina]WAQ84175.1 hypothetical protein PtA15_4A627 [Puccinia triticina]WAR55007.1 hypothetical protein PtB15_4B625 [Puccinia triticina]
MEDPHPSAPQLSEWLSAQPKIARQALSLQMPKPQLLTAPHHQLHLFRRRGLGFTTSSLPQELKELAENQDSDGSGT